MTKSEIKAAKKKAVKFALGIADDPKHGYDQVNRFGPNYDCSGLVISAFEQAGIPVKSKYGAITTSNMLATFKKAGFADVVNKVDLQTGKGLESGDVLLHIGHHTALFYGGKVGDKIVHASINENGEAKGGKSGDQTGKEVCRRHYYNHPWDHVLRLV